MVFGFTSSWVARVVAFGQRPARTASSIAIILAKGAREACLITAIFYLSRFA
jgi:hypothetical protein